MHEEPSEGRTPKDTPRLSREEIAWLTRIVARKMNEVQLELCVILGRHERTEGCEKCTAA